MSKTRNDSWGESFREVARIYSNAKKSNKFVATFFVGIILCSSFGIWMDYLSQYAIDGKITSFRIENYFTYIVAFLSILIIDGFLTSGEVRDELKGLGIFFIGITIFITFVTFYLKSKWILLAYFLCLLIYIAIEADKDKYDGKDDNNPINTQKFDILEDEE
jgi:hypothetical protein